MKKERNNGRKASSEALMIPSADANLDSRGRREVGRRSFLKGLGMAGATLLPASALLTTRKAEAPARRRSKRTAYQRRCGNPAVPGRGRNPRERSLGTILGTGRNPGDRFRSLPLGGCELPLGGTRSTRTPSRFLMTTCPSTSSTIPMMRSATRTSSTLT